MSNEARADLEAMFMALGWKLGLENTDKFAADLTRGVEAVAREVMAEGRASMGDALPLDGPVPLPPFKYVHEVKPGGGIKSGEDRTELDRAEERAKLRIWIADCAYNSDETGLVSSWVRNLLNYHNQACDRLRTVEQERDDYLRVGGEAYKREREAREALTTLREQVEEMKAALRGAEASALSGTGWQWRGDQVTDNARLEGYQHALAKWHATLFPVPGKAPPTEAP